MLQCLAIAADSSIVVLLLYCIIGSVQARVTIVFIRNQNAWQLQNIVLVSYDCDDQVL